MASRNTCYTFLTYSRFPTYPHVRQPLSSNCGHCKHCLRPSHSRPPSAPSLPEFSPVSKVLWAELTSASSAMSLNMGYSCGSSLRASCRERSPQTSPGKNDSFHPMQPPHLPCGVRAVLDFALYGKLVRPCSAFYEVPVRQLGTLPPASFRFRLATFG